MNNKGFTLIELLATIVILGLVMGIATNGVISYINTSKKRSELLFVEKTSKLIDDYLSLKGSTLSIVTNNAYTFNKEYEDLREKEKKRTEEVTVNELESFNLSNIIDENLVDINDFINPSNKEKCLVINNTGEYINNPQIKVWKDTDFVYYYYADLSEDNTSCNISKENGIISNIPEKLCTQMSGNYDEGKCILS